MIGSGELTLPPDASQDVSHSWPDTFLNVLTAPISSFKRLADPTLVNIDRSAIFGALLVVLLAASIESQAHVTLRGDMSRLASLGLALVGHLTLWYSLAWFISYLSSWRSTTVELKRALVLSGWAFLPLIFTGPCALLCQASSGWDMTLNLITLWFVYLQIDAFDALLKLGRAKTISLLIVLPPVLFLAYLFWVLCVSALVLSSLAHLLPIHTS